MAIPPGIVTVLGGLAGNAKVQEFAGRLASDVYGRIMPGRRTAGQVAAKEALPVGHDDRAQLAQLAERLDAIPTRDELVAAFAMLQAELDRQHRKTRVLLLLVAGLCLVVLLTVVAFAVFG